MALRLVPAHRLPSIDLSRTLLSCVTSTYTCASATRWIRRHQCKLAWCNRIGIVGIFAGFFVPRAIGSPTMVVSTLFCFVGGLPTLILLNVPMLLLLLRQFDFWVFSFFNTVNWSICAALFGDLRAFSCFACWLNTMLIICIDANTRTLTKFMRGATLWFPGIAIITVTCMFRLLDIDSIHFESLISTHDDDDTHARMSLTSVNLFANVSITVSVYVGIRLYYKREVLAPRFRQQRRIPSSIYRVGLAFEMDDVALKTRRSVAVPSTHQIPNAVKVSTSSLPTPVSSTNPPMLKRMFSSSPWRSSRIFDGSTSWSGSSTLSTTLPTDGIQQLELIRPRFTSFSSNGTLIRGLNGQGSVFTRIAVGMSGSVGFIATLYGLMAQPHTTAVSIVGLVLSSAFAFIVLANCNRQMLWSLTRNFDTLYFSFQTCASALSSHLSEHSRNTHGVSSSALLLWLHIILVLDALLPDARQRLGLKKHYFTPPLLVAIPIQVFLLEHLLTGSTRVMPKLKNRAILCLGDDDFCIYTLSFLFMRLVSLSIVLLRLLWMLVTQHENELIFFRGRIAFTVPVDYLPFEVDDADASNRVVATIIKPDSGDRGSRTNSK